MRPRLTRKRTGRQKSRHRRGDVLVRGVDLLLERVELRIAEHLPPLSTDRFVRGLSNLPGGAASVGGRGKFLERGRRGYVRSDVLRTDYTAAHETAHEQRHEPHRRLGKLHATGADFARRPRAERKKLVRSRTCSWKSSRYR